MAESFSRKVIADQALEKFLAALAALALPGAAWQSWSHFNKKSYIFSSSGQHILNCPDDNEHNLLLLSMSSFHSFPTKYEFTGPTRKGEIAW